MVMFREDDARIIAAERAAEPRWKKIVRKLVNLSFVLIFILGLCFIALSSIGPKNPALKGGIEQYLTSLTGYKTHVGEFNGLWFFPHMRMDMEQIIFTRGDGLDLEAIGGIEQVTVASDFIDFILSRNRVRDFTLRNAFADAGILDRDSIVLNQAVVGGLGDDAHFMADGLRGTVPFTMRVALHATGREGAARYKILRHAPFMMVLGDYRVAGVMHRPFWGGVTFEIARAGMDGDAFLSGMIDLRIQKNRRIFTGYLRDETGAQADFDLYMTPDRLIGGRIDTSSPEIAHHSQMAGLLELAQFVKLVPQNITLEDEGILLPHEHSLHYVDGVWTRHDQRESAP